MNDMIDFGLDGDESYLTASRPELIALAANFSGAVLFTRFGRPVWLQS
jgi:hypothetical protein